MAEEGQAGSSVDFPTRVDRWLVLVLGGSAAVSVAAVWAAAREAPGEALAAGAIVAASGVLVAALAVPTRYTITDTELVVRSGMLRHRIPLAAIHRVYPTRNPLSAPAWSLDRLGVEYAKKRGRPLALISPQRREEFLALLATRAGLVRQGRELRRSP
jgi:membrane protein YdbS with pleckstrin-like domain